MTDATDAREDRALRIKAVELAIEYLRALGPDAIKQVRGLDHAWRKMGTPESVVRAAEEPEHYLLGRGAGPSASESAPPQDEGELDAGVEEGGTAK